MDNQEFMTGMLGGACVFGYPADTAREGEISDAWNASTTYGVDAYCIYDNKLWKCKVQNSGQVPSENSYWTNVNLASEINKNASDISTLNSTIDDLEGFLKPVDVTDWFSVPEMQFGTFKAIKSGFTITISGLITVKQRVAFTLKGEHGYKIVSGQGINFQVNYNGWTHDSQVMISPSFSGSYGIILDNAASPYQYINYRIPIFIEKI